jgi:hypothetical protein
MLKNNAIPILTVGLNVFIIVFINIASRFNFTDAIGCLPLIVGFALSFSMTLFSTVILSAARRPISAVVFVVLSYALCLLLMVGVSAYVC